MTLHSSTPQHREEPLDEYRLGGYHPMRLGEVVNSRYEVMRKLGWNWGGKYAALKVMKGKSSFHSCHCVHRPHLAEVTDVPDLHEADYLHRVLSADPTHPGFRHNLHLLDQFHIHGPNGNHMCLVTELLGEGLDRYAKQFPRGQLPIKSVKTIMHQVIMAVSYLHEKCNILHTDIKSNNILFALPDGTILPTTPTIPTGTEVIPNVMVKLIDLGVGMYMIDFSFCGVHLFGITACWADRVEEHFTDLIQSSELRAPEVVVGAGWGKPADIWSLGCLVYELAMGEFLISHTVHGISVPHLHAIFFGPYPRNLTKDGKYSHIFFKDDGMSVLLHPQSERYPLADRIRKCRPPGDSDTEGLIQFLDLMLRLDPGERATLQTLLEHPWLASYYS
ncbi:kinase-like protein [Mycena albidolilacea]|uniref:non-specific serine/threonine protein kinase n=1 Tax=Mycena albidolilacea TaxID=1033008 RepID=A0AAD7ANL8_9AGAR|nr:kinase-like protein [Mycena albidolilacea]